MLYAVSIWSLIQSYQLNKLYLKMVTHLSYIVRFINELDEDLEQLETQLRQCKEKINTLNEELNIRISCYKESQLQSQSSLQKTQTQQAYVIRRNEVCFKFAQWRPTELDGQVGIADLALRNFVYTKVNRDNDTWSHQIELGWVKVTNLLPNSIYKDVLVPRDTPGRDDRKMTLRVLCTERPPGKWISLLEKYVHVDLFTGHFRYYHHLISLPKSQF